jgi:hypothetical protein
MARILISKRPCGAQEAQHAWHNPFHFRARTRFIKPGVIRSCSDERIHLVMSMRETELPVS